MINITLSFICYKNITYIYNVLKIHCKYYASIVNGSNSFPFRLQKEVEMNMKKLLTTTFITVFFIIGSAFSAFASENDLSDQAQQAETY